jgi:hypothetical protein
MRSSIAYRVDMTLLVSHTIIIGMCHQLLLDLETRHTIMYARPPAVIRCPLTARSAHKAQVVTVLGLHSSHYPQVHAARTTCG